jgi:hypothetical protein
MYVGLIGLGFLCAAGLFVAASWALTLGAITTTAHRKP